MLTQLRLLIVEDNRGVAANIFAYFEARGHQLDAAPDGVVGLALAQRHDYDAIVVDWMLPRLDGLTLAKRLRTELGLDVPVIMLTARDGLEHKLAGFSEGIDDYLTKPFAMQELEARIQALVARSRRSVVKQRVLSVADLSYSPDTAEVVRAGRLIPLYPACRTLLECLLRQSPKVVSRDRLQRELWGDDPPDSDRLRSHMHVLRRLVDGPFDKKLIHTVHREGYRLADLG